MRSSLPQLGIVSLLTTCLLFHRWSWRASPARKTLAAYIQVEAIELSRTVPFIFAWLVNLTIRDVPKTFLSHLLTATRKAALKQGRSGGFNAARTAS